MRYESEISGRRNRKDIFEREYDDKEGTKNYE